MKRVFVIWCVAALMMIVGASTVAYGAGGNAEIIDDDVIEIFVNNKRITTDQPGLMARGRALVPIRAICEALNCRVDWDESKKLAKIQNEVTVMNLYLNSEYLYKRDRDNKTGENVKLLEVKPFIYNGRIYVLARDIAEALHAQVRWNGEKRQVYITLEFDYISEFNEYGLAEVKKNGLYGYIDESRRKIVDVIYESIGGFSEGMAAAKKNGRWGCVNTKGEATVPFEYDIMWDFSEGCAVVGKNKSFGLIDKSGKTVVPIIYDIADNFSDGMSRVMSGSKWGYVNKEGQVVIPIIYDKADSFFGGKAYVEKNNDKFYIDKTGKRI